MAKYINFIYFPPKPGFKTGIWSVRNNKSSTHLGWIKWYSFWRQYCFFPVEQTIYSTECLKDIFEFINTINIKYKNGDNPS